MKKLKKMIVGFVSLVCVLAMSAGCTTSSSMSYTFSVDNGDSIKVTLDTSDKYSITSDVPFTISCNGEEMAQGTCIQGEAYAQYAENAEKAEKVQILDSGTKDGNEYIFWSYDNKEFDYAILIKDSNTGMVLSSLVSEEAAKECFNRLTISKVN